MTDVTRQTGRTGVSDLAAMALLWILLIIIVGPRGDFAVIDDWVYGLSVQHILQDGSFALPSPASANVIVQSYWGALFCLPFGFSYTALRISTETVALFGLWAIFGTARDLGATRWLAWLLVGSIALNPIFFQLSNSFMTDVPFTSLCMISLFLFVRGMSRRDTRLLAAAFVVALVSVMLRQFGLLFVAAYGVGLVIQQRGSLRSWLVLLGTSIFGVAMHVGFQRWMISSGRTHVEGIKSLNTLGPGWDRVMIDMSVTSALLLLCYVGVMLAPVYFATGFGSTRALIRQKPRFAWISLALLLVLQVAATINRHVQFPDYGSHIYTWGLGPMMLHDGYMLFTNFPPALPGFIWPVVWIIGMIIAAAALTDLLATTITLIRTAFRKHQSETLWFDAALLAMILLYELVLIAIIVRPGVFDRYLLLLVPPLALFAVMHRGADKPPAWSVVASWTLLAATGWFSIAATHDFLAFQRARLAATDTLEAAGVARTSIDGGYEYNGRYLNSPDIYPNYYRDNGLPLIKSWWWVRDDEYVIASGAIGGYAEQKSFPYLRWLTGSLSRVVILHRLPGSKGEATNLLRKSKD